LNSSFINLELPLKSHNRNSDNLENLENKNKRNSENSNLNNVNSSITNINTIDKEGNNISQVLPNPQQVYMNQVAYMNCMNYMRMMGMNMAAARQYHFQDMYQNMMNQGEEKNGKHSKHKKEKSILLYYI